MERYLVRTRNRAALIAGQRSTFSEYPEGAYSNAGSPPPHISALTISKQSRDCSVWAQLIFGLHLPHPDCTMLASFLLQTVEVIPHSYDSGADFLKVAISELANASLLCRAASSM